MAKPGLGKRHQAIAVIVRKRAANGEPCYICHQPIDTRPAKDGGPPTRSRWSFSAHHIEERNNGGQTVLANYAPAHFGCNSSWGDGSTQRSKRKPWRPRKW
ncbi:HNH endonuclease [Actinomadura sp. WMMA1423]|uniref:HNH endonuclease n=1 Tax=Actinomadura sp. WMMA1423 TaxID=2591108 RepID=UPI0011474424|nr:HNH endonuclease [Actinomadura sp. WMMA1423]